MSEDRELLELAARAIGFEWFEAFGDGGPSSIKREDGSESRLWNPLKYDGDALRLAVELNMAITIDFDRPTRKVVAGCNGPTDDDGACAVERGEDHFAATRRAIVRAAAEIGRQITD